MSDYTPTTDEVRLEYMAVRWGKSNIVSFDARAEFDRWLAEIERAAAEKAWGEGTRAQWRLGQTRDIDQIPANPYRREGKE